MPHKLSRGTAEKTVCYFAQSAENPVGVGVERFQLGLVRNSGLSSPETKPKTKPAIQPNFRPVHATSFQFIALTILTNNSEYTQTQRSRIQQANYIFSR
jgi:hypothetical protein